MNPLLNNETPEIRLYEKLEGVWKEFCELTETEERDLNEFKAAIRHAEHVLLIRNSRRILRSSAAQVLKERGNRTGL